MYTFFDLLRPPHSQIIKRKTDRVVVISLYTSHILTKKNWKHFENGKISPVLPNRLTHNSV